MTSPPAPPTDHPSATGGPRRSRGRVLVIGDELIGTAFDPAQERVENVFEAIGEIDRAPAGRPVGVVVLGGGVAPEATEALGRLDPSVVVVHAGEDRDLDLDLDRLVIHSDQDEDQDEDHDHDHDNDKDKDKDKDRDEDRDLEPLGDTDLVEALLNSPDGLTTTALRLIRQQTGWSDVELVGPGAERPDDGRTAVAVVGVGALRLVTAGATAREVEPWARWLETWLELDRSYRSYREMAYHDELTGTWNRRYFHRFLSDSIAEARRCRRPVTVMVFDIDDFKRFNDDFGHEAGDVILCETVGLLHSVIRECDRVCRIGGDEFAVVFADLEGPRETGSRHPDSVGLIARRFQAQIRSMQFPKLGLEAPGSLSISAGLATFPWDGDDPRSLQCLADERALESKRKGKNFITMGPEATQTGSTPG